MFFLGTLICDLYEGFFQEMIKENGGWFENFRDKRVFYEYIFPEQEYYTNLTRSDYKKTHEMKDWRFSKLPDYVKDRKKQNAREEKIRYLINRIIIANSLQRFKETLVKLLENINAEYHDTALATNLKGYIAQKDATKSDAASVQDWTEIMMLYVFFAVSDSLPQNMAIRLYPRYEEDIKEYTEKIVNMYGTVGRPGIYCLYSLVNREVPNVIAAYECGELEYYGKTGNGTVNYENAFRYYNIAISGNKIHPLAKWSISYMRYHYILDDCYNDVNRRVKAFDDEIKRNGIESWHKKTVDMLRECDLMNCSAAWNLIGQIIDDKSIPREAKGEYAEKESAEYYKLSADAEYVFGINNYAQCLLRSARKKRSSKEIKCCINEAMKYFEKAAEIGHPWSMNYLARIYLGEVCLSDSKPLVKSDYNKAFMLLQRAYTAFEKEEEHRYWSYFYLCQYFYLNKDSSHFFEEGVVKIANTINTYLEGPFSDVELKKKYYLLQSKVESLVKELTMQKRE